MTSTHRPSSQHPQQYSASSGLISHPWHSIAMLVMFVLPNLNWIIHLRFRHAPTWSNLLQVSITPTLPPLPQFKSILMVLPSPKDHCRRTTSMIYGLDDINDTPKSRLLSSQKAYPSWIRWCWRCQDLMSRNRMECRRWRQCWESFSIPARKVTTKYRLASGQPTRILIWVFSFRVRKDVRCSIYRV